MRQEKDIFWFLVLNSIFSVLKAQYKQSAFCTLLNVFILSYRFILRFTLWGSQTRYTFIHQVGYQVIMKTLFCARSCTRCREHMCKNVTEGETEAREDEVILPKSTELYIGGTGTHTQIRHVARGAPLSTQSHRPILQAAGIQSDDHPSPATLSLFLSSSDLHIAKWWNYTVHNSKATLLLKKKWGME